MAQFKTSRKRSFFEQKREKKKIIIQQGPASQRQKIRRAIFLILTAKRYHTCKALLNQPQRCLKKSPDVAKKSKHEDDGMFVLAMHALLLKLAPQVSH